MKRSFCEVQKLKAIILAGGPPPGSDSGFGDVQHKCLYSLNGVRIIDRMHQGLLRSQTVSRVIVVEPPNHCISQTDPRLHDVTFVVADGYDFRSTLQAACKALDADETALFLCSDLLDIGGNGEGPTPIDQLVSCAGNLPEYDLFLPLVSGERFRDVYPGVRKSSIRTSDGELMVGNGWIATRQTSKDNSQIFCQVFDQRKSLTGLAALFGIETIIRLLLSKRFPEALTLEMLEEKARSMIKGELAILCDQPPELARDIDKP